MSCSKHRVSGLFRVASCRFENGQPRFVDHRIFPVASASWLSIWRPWLSLPWALQSWDEANCFHPGVYWYKPSLHPHIHAAGFGHSHNITATVFLVLLHLQFADYPLRIQNCMLIRHTLFVFMFDPHMLGSVPIPLPLPPEAVVPVVLSSADLWWAVHVTQALDGSIPSYIISCWWSCNTLQFCLFSTCFAAWNHFCSQFLHEGMKVLDARHLGQIQTGWSLEKPNRCLGKVLQLTLVAQILHLFAAGYGKTVVWPHDFTRLKGCFWCFPWGQPSIALYWPTVAFWVS